MKKLFLIFLFAVPLNAFTTLEQAQEHAQGHQEYPPIENENVLNPRFKKYHESITPGAFTRLLHWLGLYTQPWTPNDLEVLATKVLTNLKKAPKQTVSLSVREGTEFIIIGPLFGAYHSLVRILTDLNKRGIIDNNLKLKKKLYLVLNGNVIDGSPYTLETLTLVLSLLAQNSTQVIYLQGQHEHKTYWLNHGLKYELQHRSSLERFKPLLTELFAHLPTMLDIRHSDNDNYLRIASLPLKEAPDAKMKTLIEAEQRTVSYANHPGIAQLQPEQNTTIWSVFSAPTELYQKYYNFYYDAYVMLTIATPIVNSTVALYNRDARNDKAPFIQSARYNIVTAQKLPTENLIDIKPANIISLGSTMDLSRTLKSLGTSIKAGLSAAVNNINRTGGINNKLFRLYIEDDQYLAPIARANIERFMKDVSPIILTPVGSPTLAAVIDLIRDNKIYVLFPASGSLLFRDPSLTSIINFRASYSAEAEALTYYIRKKLLGKDFAFFYQDDAYGYAPLNGARSMLKKLGIEKWTETSYQTNTVRVDEAVDAIKKANPDVIGLFSVATATIEFIKRLGVEFLATKKLFAISPLGDDAFKQFLDSMGLKVTFAQVVPNPESTDLEIVKEYRQEIAKLGKQPDTYSLEGYIAASITANIFKSIEGPLTMNSLKNVIEGIKDYNYKGLRLNYNPKNRQLANELWIETPSGQWIKQEVAELEALKPPTKEAKP